MIIGDLVRFRFGRGWYPGIILEIIEDPDVRPTLITVKMLDFDGKTQVFDVWKNDEYEILSCAKPPPIMVP